MARKRAPSFITAAQGRTAPPSARVPVGSKASPYAGPLQPPKTVTTVRRTPRRTTVRRTTEAPPPSVREPVPRAAPARAAAEHVRVEHAPAAAPPPPPPSRT